MLKEKVTALLEEALASEPSLFLIDFTVSPDHAIKVVLDGDVGVNLQDCMKISRAIEHNLDREAYDFSLEVTSSGAAAPLVMPRQYRKNIGRIISVRTMGESYEGNLAEISDTGIVLAWKAREPKPLGKGKT
ncbi:MAG: ribosome assembly cofactor RimP, partial [Flavobacteriales bacterium]